jgi:proteasome lid subunit RPN8/RPN11
MKTSNRVQRDGATRPAPVQAKSRTPSAPAEFKIVRLRECPVDNPTIETPPQLADFWRKYVVSAPWFKDDKECLCVFLLNTRHRLVGFELVCQGTLDTLLMHPREVFHPAAVHSAAAVIIAHNHPSGDPTPSEMDIKVTRDLIRASEILKIPLLDHIIIGDARQKNSFASLLALGHFSPASPAKRGKEIYNDSKVSNALRELKNAKVQSNALSKLLADNMDYYSRNGCEFSGKEVESMCAGVAQLVSFTNGCLEDAFGSIFNAIHPRRSEVAS